MSGSLAHNQTGEPGRFFGRQIEIAWLAEQLEQGARILVIHGPPAVGKTALLRKLKDVFRRHQSQPLDRVVKLINPMLRGWVAYFAVGNSSECFGFVTDWVEKKIRRIMERARNRNGFGWKRWSTRWLYESLRLFNGYKVRWSMQKVAPAR